MEDLMRRVVWFILLPAVLAVSAAAQSKPQEPAAGSRPAAVPDSKKEDCGCEQKAPPDVLAIVNGVKISTKEIDDLIKDKVEELRKEVIDARKQELTLEINTKLIDDEAGKRGITSAKLLDIEVVSKVKNPTEEDARTFYEQNRTRIQGEFKDVKNELIAYLRKGREREEALKLAERLRAQGQVKVLLNEVTPPETPA